MENAKAPKICSSGSFSISWKSLLNLTRPSASKVYNINDTIGIKLITRLRLSFSHLQEIKFKRFQRHTKTAFLL